VLLPYRLCAIDLDDTLLGPDHRISARNARAVHAVGERGVTVVIASGRMHEATLRFADQLTLETPIISYNGAMVRLPHTDDVWLHERIPAELAQVVVDYSREHDLQLNYYLHDHLYTLAYTPWMRLYHERTLAPVEVRSDFYDLVRGQEPTKLIIVDSPEVTNGLLPAFRERFGARLYVTKSNDEYLEFMPPHANKGAALALVAQRYGVTEQQTVAFGDSWNDVPMLQWAGLGIAVGNAKPAAIAAADRTVLRNDEDGVAVGLEEIFGLQTPLLKEER
jgi:Cof subfamily protein (haloacid dehalogenase superfamily)